LYPLATLVTGGTGFLGSYLVRYLVLDQGQDDVVVFDRYVDRVRLGEVADDVMLIEGDIADFDAVRSVVQDCKVDRIAHFAFLVGSPLPGQLVPYARVQCGGTANVMEAARLAGVSRVVYASSVAAYGAEDDTAPSLLHEDWQGIPRGPYGAAKLWGESLGRYCTRNYGLDVITLRFSSTYGLGRAWRGSYRSGMSSSNEHHYMARVEAAVRGQAITMPGDDQVVDWTYAADAAQAGWLALTAENPPHRLYNVQGEQRRIGDFTASLREQLPDVEITVDDTELPGTAHRFLDGARLRTDLGFTPKYPLESGVPDYVGRVRDYIQRSEGGQGE
jgi:UDP-glucose 4-epimerase